MQMGFNNDVVHLGRTLHIQTEDHGMVAKKITSQLFVEGAILDSKTLSYADALAGLGLVEEQQEFIRRQMRTMHKAIFKRVQEGLYDDMLVHHRKRHEEISGQFLAVVQPAPKDGPAELPFLGAGAPGRLAVFEADVEAPRHPAMGLDALQSEDPAPVSSGNRLALEPPTPSVHPVATLAKAVAEASPRALRDSGLHRFGGIGTAAKPGVKEANASDASVGSNGSTTNNTKGR